MAPTGVQILPMSFGEQANSRMDVGAHGRADTETDEHERVSGHTHHLVASKH